MQPTIAQCGIYHVEQYTLLPTYRAGPDSQPGLQSLPHNTAGYKVRCIQLFGLQEHVFTERRHANAAALQQAYMGSLELQRAQQSNLQRKQKQAAEQDAPHAKQASDHDIAMLQAHAQMEQQQRQISHLTTQLQTAEREQQALRQAMKTRAASLASRQSRREAEHDLVITHCQELELSLSAMQSNLEAAIAERNALPMPYPIYMKCSFCKARTVNGFA